MAALHTRMAVWGVAGATAGIVAHVFAADTEGLAGVLRYGSQPLGQMFLRLLQMLVVPLAFSALALGVAEVGDIVDVKAPSGHFHLDVNSRTPVVLIGGGIGVTPALSMLNYLIAAPGKREVWFFYGVRNGREHVLKDYLREIAEQNSQVHLVLCYSDPLPGEEPEKDYTFSERVSVDLFKRVLEVNNFDFYICGPPPMMESLVKDLSEWGVPEERINFEAFGPASVKKLPKAESAQVADTAGVEVSFVRAGKTVPWSNATGSLLELAEAHGIRIDSGCRAGSCGTCITAIRDGQVDYPSGKPDFDIEKGSCLACVAVPKGALSLNA